MKVVTARLKLMLRWVLPGIALFFLATVLRQNWQHVGAIQISAAGWSCLAIALGVTLLAHISAGWVWSRILQRDFSQPVDRSWLIQAYLQTNIAKYLPGNVWHYYGRVSAAIAAGATLPAATVSVLLEPLLMAASALLVALLSGQPIASRHGGWALGLQWLILVATLISIHPNVLNPLMQQLAKLKQSALPSSEAAIAPLKLNHYPLAALIGNFMFLLLRGTGFILTFLAIRSLTLAQVPLLLSGFSVAWLLGLVVPGAPGGLGIFEATAIALLGGLFSPGLVLGVVALYRLISVTAEALGAGLAWSDRRTSTPKPLNLRQ